MKKIIIASITAVVVITVLAGCLMPVLDDATAKTGTFENEGVFNMSYVTSSDTDAYTLSYDVATNALTVNGEVFDMDKIGNATYSVIAADTFFLRLQPNTRAYIMGSTGSTQATYFGFNADSLAISMASGTLTATATTNGTDSTATYTYNKAYVLDESGNLDYIMKTSASQVYVLKDSVLFASGQTSINTSGSPLSTAITMEGNIEDGVTFTAIKGATTATFDNIDIDASPVDGYDGLYSLSKVTATATYDGTDTDITYSYFVVPAEVTADKTVQLTDGENAILGVIPIFVIVALLISIVALVIRSKMD